MVMFIKYIRDNKTNNYSNFGAIRSILKETPTKVRPPLINTYQKVSYIPPTITTNTVNTHQKEYT